MATERAAPGIGGVALVPTDARCAALAPDIARRLSRRVSVPCRIERADALGRLPRLAHRDQVDADAFLACVERLARPDGEVLVALTAEDIGHPIFTFFFGRARQGGSSAVVSLHRLAPEFAGLPDDAAVTVARAVQEVLHELGHIAGLVHCRSASCVMRFSADLDALDRRGTAFCTSCAALVPVSPRAL